MTTNAHGLAGIDTKDGPLWTIMNHRPRLKAGGLSSGDVPTAPGVYVWYRDGKAIYAGRAVGTRGIRGRVWSNHLDRGNDLSRSSFRRNVCEHLGIASTVKTRIRPTAMAAAELEPVNQWVRECDVAWIECGSPSEATSLERLLLAEWMPPLSRR